jgi:predicted O-methyltransferase YrrM
MYQPKESPHIYHKLLHQKRETELILSALRLDIFSYLEDWSTSKVVSEKTGFNARNLELFLNVLSSIGMLEKNKALYRNTPQSNEYLNKNSSVYLGEYILFREKMMSLQHLDERIKQGPIQDIVVNNSGVEVYDFYELARVSIPEIYSCRIQPLIKSATIIFKDRPPKKILDLGGGSGILAMELVNTFPSCKGVIFEHPSVAQLPHKIISEKKLSDKVSVLEGDFNTDDIGQGYDLIIASGIFDFAKDHLDELMEKLYNALTHNGYLYVVTHNVSEDYQAPPQSILGWLSSHLDGLDLLLTKNTINQALTNHGFKRVVLEDTKGTFEGFNGKFYSKAEMKNNA